MLRCSWQDGSNP